MSTESAGAFDVAPAPRDDGLCRRGGLSISGLLGGIIVVLVMLIVFGGPLVWRLAPDEQNLVDALQGMSLAHPLGTDQQGRDLLARVMAGGRVSLLIAFASVLIGLVCGTSLGITAAFGGNLVRGVSLRFIDSLLALPGIVQAVIFVAVLGQGTVALIVALGIYSTPIFARVAYTSTLQVMNENYFAAARVLGARLTRIVRWHVLPNIATPLVTIGTLRIGANVLTGAALNFFGLGVQPPAPEWGLMIADGRDFSWDNPLLILCPGIALFLVSLGFSMLGDALRDWLDPQTSGR